MGKKKKNQEVNTKPIYVNNEKHRLFASENFNFVFDKETGVSVCWGQTINDSPEWDPVSPQELVFSMNNFNVTEFIKQVNYLANVKEQIDKTEFIDVDTGLTLEELQQKNLVVMSTASSIVLVFDKAVTEYDSEALVAFVNYLKFLNLSIIVQLNTDKPITLPEMNILKLITENIQIKTGSECSANILFDNVINLKKEALNHSIKMVITKGSFNQNFKSLSKLPANTPIKLVFEKPFVTAAQYRGIQDKIIELNFESCRMGTCFDDHFNKKTKNLKIMPMDCDACRFSLYIEDSKVYPCEFNKYTEIDIDYTKSLSELWQNKKIKKFRDTIVENNFCKKK